MRIALAVHGWPPEQMGGTELSTRALAWALVAAGHDVLVLAGTLEFSHPPSVRREREVEPTTGTSFRVVKIERSDPYFDHWQKHRAPRSSCVAVELMQEHKTEVLHVHHWVRLSTDLVRRAARAGIPAMVSLHDHYATCLLGWRVHPQEKAICKREFSAVGCSQCAGAVPPRTPWLPAEEQAMRAATRMQELAAELACARRILVPSLAHAESLLSLGLPGHNMTVVPPLAPARLTLQKTWTAPKPGQPLRVGAWGLSDEAKGVTLLKAAARRLGGRVHLVLAGHATGESEPWIETFGAYAPEDLADHPVTQVHVAACASLAMESYGLVASEAQSLGLPLVLPLIDVFSERFSDMQGVLFFEQGSEDDLTAVLDRLARERGLLEIQRRKIVREDDLYEQTVEHMQALYARTMRKGPPKVPEETWFEERMAQEAMDAWDEALKVAPRSALGLPDEESK
jgi:glycosyltransferase involved in cell wall biosynthesis